MDALIPSSADVANALQALRRGSLQRLAVLSGVPYRTLEKIRSGETKNPGIETVRAFLPHIEAAAQAPTTGPAPLS